MDILVDVNSSRFRFSNEEEIARICVGVIVI